jgi:hypothetical protein
MEGQVTRVFFIALLLAVATPAAAQETVAVADLLADPEAYSGEITIVGELIGDFGFRSEGSMWTQLNDDSYAYDPILDGGELTGGNVGVAVRIPASIAETLDDPGGYRVRGPIVAATGEWRYHDPERGGESYVDVTAIVVVESGHTLEEHPNFWVLAAGLALFVTTAWLRVNPARRRQR